MDPRTSVIEKRLKKVKRIIAVSGGKGGIGKSTVSSLLAIALSRKDCRVGLLDLDLSSPSDHVILGVENILPVEEKGIVPPNVSGVQFMSVIFYAEDKPTPLRGEEVSDAIKEILCITRWSNLDFLVVDMPPGIGDELFDVIELFRRTEFLLLTTPSRVVVETVRKLLVLLQEMKIPVIGIVENMKRDGKTFAKSICSRYKVPFLGEVRFDGEFERAVGDIDRIIHTEVFTDVQKIASLLTRQSK